METTEHVPAVGFAYRETFIPDPERGLGHDIHVVHVQEMPPVNPHELFRQFRLQQIKPTGHHQPGLTPAINKAVTTRRLDIENIGI